jgi:hypothetical protein
MRLTASSWFFPACFPFVLVLLLAGCGHVTVESMMETIQEAVVEEIMCEEPEVWDGNTCKDPSF